MLKRQLAAMEKTVFDALSLSSQLLFTPGKPTYDKTFRNPNRELRFGDPPIPGLGLGLGLG